MLQVFFDDLHEFCVKSFGLDPTVWMLRILVSLVIVITWELYWNPPLFHSKVGEVPEAKLTKQQHQQQQEETTTSARKPEQTIESIEPVVSTENLTNENIDQSNLEEEHEKTMTCLDERKLQSTSTTKPKAAVATNKKIEIDHEKTPDTPPNDSSTPSPTLNASASIASTSTTTTAAAAAVTGVTAINAAATTTTTPTAAVWEEPGLDGFHRWYETETSLYRIYTLAKRDGTAIPPYHPSSQRGRVEVELHVTNRTPNEIHVFWVDYQGKHIPKGRISKNSGVWTQTTWIDHRESFFVCVLLYMDYFVYYCCCCCPWKGLYCCSILFQNSTITISSSNY